MHWPADTFGTVQVWSHVGISRSHHCLTHRPFTAGRIADCSRAVIKPDGTIEMLTRLIFPGARPASDILNRKLPVLSNNCPPEGHAQAHTRRLTPVQYSVLSVRAFMLAGQLPIHAFTAALRIMDESMDGLEINWVGKRRRSSIFSGFGSCMTSAIDDVGLHQEVTFDVAKRPDRSVYGPSDTTTFWPTASDYIPSNIPTFYVAIVAQFEINRSKGHDIDHARVWVSLKLYGGAVHSSHFDCKPTASRAALIGGKNAIIVESDIAYL
ncbi:hypothetical protein BC629DRAFT_1726377 [Irpex lacteus]|nr:hypothetical protein BC629DRAFT_1726377 [Irpex lacteus]